jgi:hypothetical protein
VKLEMEREGSGVTLHVATSDADARNFGSGASSCCDVNFIKRCILLLSSNDAGRCVQAWREGQTVSVPLGRRVVPSRCSLRVMPSF